MNTIETLLTQIAQTHLGIQTLETRNSDSLDFHDVAVWSLREALAAAYKAGAEQGVPTHKAALVRPSAHSAPSFAPPRSVNAPSRGSRPRTRTRSPPPRCTTAALASKASSHPAPTHSPGQPAPSPPIAKIPSRIKGCVRGSCRRRSIPLP